MEPLNEMKTEQNTYMSYLKLREILVLVNSG